MVFRIRYTLIFTILTILTVPLFSNETLEASLIIVGPGDPLYTYWGHIGIAIENKETGENLFYDFGNFSFYSDNFYQGFAMGRMMYLGLVTPTDYFISYSLMEDRNFTIYPLNLGDEELLELDNKLQWWVRPENREYLYDYYLNNCSTIIRDILNDVTDGELKRFTESRPDLDFRHYSRTGADPSLFSEILLHYLLGSDLDKPISAWDKMFLPQAVADYALEMEYTGRDDETRKLAGDGTVLKSSTRRPVPEKPRMLWPIMLIMGLTAGIGWRLSGTVKRKPARIAGTVYRAFIILSIGLPGLILGFLMAFTDHAASYRNINIWPSFPTVLIGLIPLTAAIGRGRLDRRKSEVWLSWIWTVNLAGLLLAVVLRLSGIYMQDAFAFWAFFAPLTLAASRPGLWLQDKLGRQYDP